LLGVELWAEIRRLKYVEGLSQREIHRRTGVHRDTIRRALASSTPPSYGPRPPRSSKLEPFVATIEELLADGPTLSGVRIREELGRLGYDGGKTILDDLLRELRPRFLPPPRSFLTCSLAALTGQAAVVRWVCPPSFQVAATSSGVW
jgi:transposase